MSRFSKIDWQMWFLTDLCIIAGLFADHRVMWAAIFMTAIQPPVIAILRGNIGSFPSQVRLAFMLILIAGMWSPLSFLHWVQLVGINALLIFDYCFLARCLSLAPGNRKRPLTPKLVAETFFSAPVRGSFIASLAARETLV